MTTQHTPGSWIVSHNAGEQMGGWKTNPYSVVVHPKGVHRTTVANIPERATISEEQKKANALLIAAAPELLEACQTFSEWLRREDEGWVSANKDRSTPEGEAAWREWFYENLRICNLAQDQVKAAIAKATGEQA